MKCLGLLIGVAFGFLLGAARFTDYDVIHDGLLLKTASIYLVMGSAVVTAAILLGILHSLKWWTPLGGPLTLDRAPIERRHIIGGLIFGVGWAAAGTCPAVASAMVGSGRVLGLVVMVGLALGILLRDAQTGQSARPAQTPLPTVPSQPTNARS